MNLVAFIKLGEVLQFVLVQARWHFLKNPIFIIFVQQNIFYLNFVGLQLNDLVEQGKHCHGNDLEDSPNIADQLERVVLRHGDEVFGPSLADPQHWAFHRGSELKKSLDQHPG